MKTVTVPVTFLWVLITALMLCMGCKKSDDVEAPMLGTISGTVSPAGSTTNIVLNSTPVPPATVLPPVNVVPDNSGYFKLTNLPLGTYNLAFTPVAGLKGVNGNGFTIVLDKLNLSIPTKIELQADPQNGRCLIRYNGSDLPFSYPDVTSSFYNNNWILRLQVTKDKYMEVTVYNLTAPGIYHCDKGAANVYVFNYPSGVWYANRITGGSGSIEITAFDPILKRVSGTFNFIAVPGNPFTSGNQVVSNSLFTNVAF